MRKDSVVSSGMPEQIVEDPLTEVLREGARELIARAVRVEVEEFLAHYDHVRDEAGRKMVVKNGYLPERTIQTGVGSVPVKAPRVRDRRSAEERVEFSSALLPKYLRRTKTIEALIPWLYLKGVSTGDFTEALAALLGVDACGLSPSTISRLKDQWKGEYEGWRQRELSGRRYLYLWADGVYPQVRLEGSGPCFLVILGARENGTKELLVIEDGERESEQSWREVLVDLKSRGLSIPPQLATGDGALGFWKALRKVYPETRVQRCWVHKTANVLNKLPKTLQRKAKQGLHEIWMAETKEEAQRAFDAFVEIYSLKYPKAVECLEKDREELLSFYDFPAEHWVHIRTTNPIESTFATVKLRTAKTRGCLSRETALTMVFQLCRSAEKSWRKLNGPKRCAEVIEGVRFVNGIRENRRAA
jgi:transposase-like protein